MKTVYQTTRRFGLCATGLLLAGWGACLQAENIYTRAPGTNYDSTFELQAVQLQGTDLRRSEWYRMDTINYASIRHGSGFPGGPWSHPLPPNATFGPDNTARLYKGTLENPQSSLNGNLASSGIYTGFTQTPFMVREKNPVADLHTLVFQLFTTTGAKPFPDTWQDVYGQDGDLSQLPVLRYETSDGVWHTLQSDNPNAAPYQSSQVPFNHMPVEGMDDDTEVMLFENYRLYSWDLSVVELPIVSFAIEFELFAHVGLRSLSLDQAGGMVPEPGSTAVILSLTLLCGTILRRRLRCRP